MDKGTASSTNVEFEIVHAVRGRVRLRLKSDDVRELLPRIAHHIRQQADIHTVQIKQTSNSLVVTFDPNAISVEQLTNLLQPFGAIAIPTPESGRSPGGSHTVTYSRLFALVPPLVGLGVARSLQVSGWKSILTYILGAGVTREVMDRITAESESVELSPVQKVSITEVAEDETSTFLTAIETDYEIVHHIPGRIRLRVPRINRDRQYARELKRLLEQDKRITDIRLKTNSSSVVILYNPEALADARQEKAALNGSNANQVIQSVDESESSTIPDQKTNSKKPATESDLNDTPPPGDKTSSEPSSLTSETETDTSKTLETEAESTTPIAHDESEIETPQEFSNGETISRSSNYWSDFKFSMLLTMLQLMGNLQVQTAEI